MWTHAQKNNPNCRLCSHSRVERLDWYDLISLVYCSSIVVWTNNTESNLFSFIFGSLSDVLLDQIQIRFFSKLMFVIIVGRWESQIKTNNRTKRSRCRPEILDKTHFTEAVRVATPPAQKHTLLYTEAPWPHKENTAHSPCLHFSLPHH